MKGLNFSKRSVARFVDEQGRRLRRSHNDRGFTLVRPSRPAPAMPSLEERAAQSKRDFIACLRSKRRKGIDVRRMVGAERRAA